MNKSAVLRDTGSFSEGCWKAAEAALQLFIRMIKINIGRFRQNDVILNTVQTSVYEKCICDIGVGAGIGRTQLCTAKLV